MAKSLKNFVTIQEALERHHPQAVRYFLISTHYRAPLDYSDQGLKEAGKRVESVYETLARIDSVLARAGKVETEGDLVKPEVSAGLLDAFRESMDDDFNTAAALGKLSEPLRLANEIAERPKSFGRPVAYMTLARIRADISRIAGVLGVFDMEPREFLDSLRERRARERGIDPGQVQAMLDQRAEARKAKDWARADQIRDRLKEMGVEVMDTAEGTSWKVTD